MNKNNEKTTTLNSLKYHNINNHKSRINLDQEASPPQTTSKKIKEDEITVIYTFIIQYSQDEDGNKDLSSSSLSTTPINTATKHELVQLLLYTNNLFKQVININVNSTFVDEGNHSPYCNNDNLSCILLTININISHDSTISSKTIRHFLLTHSSNIQNVILPALPFLPLSSYVKYIGQDVFSANIIFDMIFDDTNNDNDISLSKEDVRFFENNLLQYINTEWMLDDQILNVTSIVVIDYNTLFTNDKSDNDDIKQRYLRKILDYNNTLRLNTEILGEYPSTSTTNTNIMIPRYNELITNLFQKNNKNIIIFTNVLRSYNTFNNMKSISSSSSSYNDYDIKTNNNMNETLILNEENNTTSIWTNHTAIIIYAIIGILIYYVLYYVLYVKLYRHRNQKEYDTSDYNNGSWWYYIRNHNSSGQLSGTARITMNDDDDDEHHSYNFEEEDVSSHKMTSTINSNTTSNNNSSNENNIRRVLSDSKLIYHQYNSIPQLIIKRSSSFDLSQLIQYDNSRMIMNQYSNRNNSKKKSPKSKYKELEDDWLCHTIVATECIKQYKIRNNPPIDTSKHDAKDRSRRGSSVACEVMDENKRPKRIASIRSQKKKNKDDQSINSGSTNRSRRSNGSRRSRKQYKKISQRENESGIPDHITPKKSNNNTVTYVSSTTINEIIENEKESYLTGKQQQQHQQQTSIPKIPVPVQEVPTDNSKRALLRQNEELSFVNETFDDDHVAKLNSKAVLKDLQSSLLKITVPKEFNRIREKRERK